MISASYDCFHAGIHSHMCTLLSLLSLRLLPQTKTLLQQLLHELRPCCSSHLILFASCFFQLRLKLLLGLVLFAIATQPLLFAIAPHPTDDEEAPTDADEDEGEVVVVVLRLRLRLWRAWRQAWAGWQRQGRARSYPPRPRIRAGLAPQPPVRRPAPRERASRPPATCAAQAAAHRGSRSGSADLPE